MRVVVTGAATILGRPLCLALSELGHDVTAQFRTPNSWLQGLENKSRIRLIQGDLANARDARMTVPEGTEMVFHLAATSAGHGITAEKMFRDNTEATRLLANTSVQIGVSRFVYFSSISIHGEIQAGVLDESSPIINPTPYGVSKLAAEQILASQAAAMPCVSLRLPAVVGRGAHRHWLATVVAKALADDDIAIFSPDSLFNNTVYAQDLVRFLSLLLHKSFSGFCAVPLASAGSVKIRKVVQIIVDKVKSNSAIVKSEKNSESFTIDYSMAEREFGYSPMSTEDVLERYSVESRVALP
jgi:nucleoside-diphosphate-sugar epimerase